MAKNVKCQLGEVCHHSAGPHPCSPSSPSSLTPTLSHSKSPLFLPPYSSLRRSFPLLTLAHKGWLPPPPANGGCLALAESDSVLWSPISQHCWLLSIEGFVNYEAKCGTHVVHLLNTECGNIAPLCFFKRRFCHRQVWVIKGRVWWEPDADFNQLTITSFT